MLRMGRKRDGLLVWLGVFLLLAVPLYGQSILTQAVSGTGFIVSSDGYVLTNKHVINGATDITVKIGGKEYKAKVVDSLSNNDIALLKIDAHGLPTVMLGDSDNVQIGDTVYAIGCPAGVCGTITEGRVANLGISSKTDEGTTLHNLIMSDLTTTHGSSGGPLLNDKGEVIGITTAGIVVQGETTGFGVSIPINQAIPLLQQVPGFSTSQMGKATRVLSLTEVRQSVGAGTAFVQAEVQRALTDLLPRQALGRSLQCGCNSVRLGSFMSGITIMSAGLADHLEARHGHIRRVCEAYNETVSGDAIEDIVIDVFGCSSPSYALRALTYLRAPTTWDFSDYQPDLLNPFNFEQTFVNRFLRQSSVLSSNSQNISGLTVSTAIYYYAADNSKGPCGQNPSSVTTTPSLELWGFASFTIDNLAFLVVYRSLLWGPEYPGCTGSTLPGGSILWVGIPYEWKRVGHSFVFSSEEKRLFSVNYSSFLDNFDQLITTVLNTLANQ